MPLLLENTLHRVIYYPEIGLLKHVYTAQTGSSTWSEIEGAFISYIKLLSIYKPKLLLVDMSSFHFILQKEMQDWVAENIVATLLKINLRKWASIVSTQLFSQMSIEQIMETTKDHHFETRYFHNEEEALDWLLSSRTDPKLIDTILQS